MPAVPAADGRTDRYARRRRRALSALATIACLAVFGLVAQLGSGLPAAAPTAEAADRPASGSLPDDPLADALDTAAAHHVTAGTYAGVDLELRYAANHRTIVVVDGRDGSCRYAGLVDGVRSDPVADPSGTACQDRHLAALQVELDRQAATAATSVPDRVVARLAVATAAVQRYAASTFRDGMRTFDGLPATVDDVQIAPGDRHDRIHLVVRVDAGCYTRTVTPTTAEPARPC